MTGLLVAGAVLVGVLGAAAAVGGATVAGVVAFFGRQMARPGNNPVAVVAPLATSRSLVLTPTF